MQILRQSPSQNPRLEVLEKESSAFPSRESATWGSDVELEAIESEQTGLAFSLPPSLQHVRASSTGWIRAWISLSQPGGMWHRFLRVRWYTANSSLRLRGFWACFSGWAPAWRPGGAAFSGLLWARGRAFARHWEACAGLARRAPRVSGFETRRAVP